MWNYRVVHITHKNGEEELSIQEVYYDEQEEPRNFGELGITGETLEELQNMVNRLNACLSKPLLYYSYSLGSFYVPS